MCAEQVNSSRAPEEISDREVSEAFTLLDEDGSGDLSAVEVNKAMKILVSEPSRTT